jgi:hypothetical protein
LQLLAVLQVSSDLKTIEDSEEPLRVAKQNVLAQQPLFFFIAEERFLLRVHTKPMIIREPNKRKIAA